MKLFEYFFGKDSSVNYLPANFCEGKSDEELLNALKGNIGLISHGSGNMIMMELLERLCKRTKNIEGS